MRQNNFFFAGKKVQPKPHFVWALFIGLLLSATVIPTFADKPSPAQAVVDAWGQVQRVDSYTYESNLRQTDHPLPRLENVGRSPNSTYLFTAGSINQLEQSLYLDVWQDGNQIGDPASAMQVKVEDGLAYGRFGDTDWQPLEQDISQMFAPGQDTMGYIAAAENVVLAGQETRAGITFTRYTFSINGPKMAAQLRDLMQQNLAQQTALPEGAALQLPQRYVNMTGQGELWIGENGLPLRQIITMQFPPEGDNWQEVQITTDYDQWQAQTTEDTTWFHRAQYQLSDPQVLGQLSSNLFLFAGVLMAGWLILVYHRRPWFHRLVVVLVIVGMLSGPWLQILQWDSLTQLLGEQEVQAAQAETAVSPTTPPFTPTQNPLAAPAKRVLTQTTLAPAEDTTDTDGDGLSDELEIRLNSNPNNPDTDADTLIDGIEYVQLGTSTIFTDTDGDLIADNIEVNGYQDGGGTWWYLNPINADTNGDGLLDGPECLDLIDTPTTTCADTDNDGLPNFADPDNDNDNVRDADDLAVNVAMGSSRDGNGQIQGFTDQTFNFDLSQMTVGVPHQLTFQFRPANPDHLWYHMSVLDWPSNDYYGNVQRNGDTTFQDIQTQSNSADANGDLRLIPMMEIEIPYSPGSYGGLPTIANPAPLTVTNPITTWLDVDKMTEFAINVSYKSEQSADLLLYVPLLVEKDEETGDPVAFNAQIPYWPDQSAFAQPQNARLVWLLQAITNRCQDFIQDHANTVIRCTSWSPDETQIIHIYADDWYLTGLSVREDMGASVSMVHEYQPQSQPGYDATSYYERGLWALYSGLETSFLAGRVDDGQRFDLGEINRRFDITSTATITAQWSITTPFAVHTWDFDMEAHMAAIPMTYTRQILDDYFPTVPVNDFVTVLFATEQIERAALLSDSPDVITALPATNGLIADNNLAVALDPDEIVPRTAVNLRLASFQNAGSGEWSSPSPDIYLDYLMGRIANNPTENTTLQSVSLPMADLRTADGFDVVKAIYYARFIGQSYIVTVGDLATPAPNTQSDPQTTVLFGDLGQTVIGMITDLVGVLTDDTTKLIDLGAFVTAFVMVVLTIIQMIIDNPTTQSVFQGIKGAVNLLEAARSIRAFLKAESQSGFFKTGGGAAAVVLAVIIIVVMVVAFLVLWLTSDLVAGSTAWNQALIRTFIATTIVLIIYAVLAATVIGDLVLGIIAIIDGIAAIVCAVIDVASDIETGETALGAVLCNGITGIFIWLIGALLYDSNPLLDMQRPDRLQFSTPQIDFYDRSLGFSAANQITATMRLTSTLYANPEDWAWEDWWIAGEEEDMRLSTLRYEFTLEEEFGDDRFHIRAGIEDEQMVDEWILKTAPDEEPAVLYITDTITKAVPLSNVVGINQSLPLYLAEGQSTGAIECVPITLSVACWINHSEDSLYIHVGARMQYDIFPATFEEFVTLTRLDQYANGYAPLWSQTGSPAWPIQADADGDGLRSPNHPTMPGNDPNDSTPDADNDGLSDFYEIKYGSDPLDSDTDDDGLDDALEAFYDTNPNMADSDQDSLSDGAEIDGWAFVYFYDAATATSYPTWVTSDPLLPDTDADGLSDQQEQLYGFNPRVFTQDAPLAINASVDDQDGFVFPGQEILYTAVISNQTTSRQAQGLLTVEFPPAVQDSTLDPQPFTLDAQTTTTLSGTVTVSPIAASQQISLTNRAGAVMIPQTTEQTLWVKFNETAVTTQFYDYSRPQNSLTCTSCPAPQAGYQANAASFNGSQYLTIGNPADLRLADTSFTIMAWVNIAQDNADHPLLTAGEESGGVWGDHMEFSIRNGRAEYEISVNGDTDGLSGGTPLGENTWYHLAWRYNSDTNTLTIFQDGVPVTTEAITPSPTAVSVTAAHIGSGTSPTDFNGLIDNLEIYPTALSDTTIAQLVLKPTVHLNFEDLTTLTDLYGNQVQSRYATLNIPSTLPPTIGPDGQAVNFLGFQHFFLPNTPTTRYPAFTHAFWVLPHTGTGLQGIAGSSNAASLADLNANAQSLNGSASIFVQDGTRLLVGFGDGTQWRTAVSQQILTPEEWNHVVLTYGEDGIAQYKVYINGLYRQTLAGTFGSAAQNPQMPAYIGSATQHGRVVYHGSYMYYTQVDGDGSNEYYLLLNNNRLNRHTGVTDGNTWLTANAANGTENSNPNQFYQFGTSLTAYEDDSEDWQDGYDDELYWDNGDTSTYFFNITQSSLDNAAIVSGQQLNNLQEPFIFGDSLLVDIDDDDPGEMNIVASHTNPSQPFKGYLDDFREYHRALSATEAAQLFNQFQPAGFRFNLDEPPGTAEFNDAFGSALQGACDYGADTCPITGIPGMANQMALFGSTSAGDTNQNDYITLPTATQSFDNEAFTLAAWVNGRDYAAATRPIIGTNDSESLSLSVVNGYPVFGFNAGNQYSQAITGTTPLNPFQWYHLAAVYSPGGGETQNWATPANGASVTLVNGTNPGNAIDNNVNTKAETTSTANAWLRVDLGQMRVIDQITIRSYNENSPPTADLTLSTDTNTTTWSTNTTLAGKQIFSVGNQYGRYFQIQLNAAATDILSVYEVILEGPDGPRRQLYVNGVLAASDVLPSPTQPYTNLFIGRSHNGTTYNYYHGYLDQVQLLPYAANIQTLMRDVPVLRLPLDEQSQPASNTFTNSVAGLPHTTAPATVACAPAACPIASPPGRLNRSALFRNSTFNSVNLAQTIGTEFTLSAWVKGLSGDYPTGNLLTLQVGVITFAQMSMNSTGLPTFFANSGGSLTYLNSNSLQPNQWYYLTWRHSETADNRAIFINGQKIAEGAAGTRPVGDLNATIGSLIGQLDDITLHAIALSDQEIARQYAYQVSWTEIADDNRIVVDNEAPNLHLSADLPAYLPQQANPLFVAIRADDLGTSGQSPFASGIMSVTYQVNGGLWQTAVPDGSLWILSLTPSAAGTLNLTIQATDRVGHTTTDTDSITVDDTTPTVAFDSAVNTIIATQTISDVVAIPLSGTASDMGSGLAHITVSLTDYQGRDVNGPQLATLTANTWDINYYPQAMNSTGIYTATVQATDNVGNTSTASTLIRVDDTPAQAFLTDIQSPESVTFNLADGFKDTPSVLESLIPGANLRGITYTADSPITLTGTLLDADYPTNAELYLSFEDNSFVGGAADASLQHNLLTCVVCPTPVSGATGQAASFATGTTLATEPISGTLDQFTVAFWLNTSGPAASAQPVFDYNNQITVERISGSQQIAFTVDTATGTNTLILTDTAVLPANTWNHLAFVYTGYQQQIFVNGRLHTTAPLTGTVPVSGLLSIGNNLSGQLDELLFYKQAWPLLLINQLANPIGREGQQIEYALVLRQPNDPVPASFSWQPTTLDTQPNDPLAHWSVTLPLNPDPGWYQIWLRTTDQYGRQQIIPRAWEGPITCGNPMRYVNPAATGLDTGLSWADAYPTLQDALAVPLCPGGQIWVAAGTYYPDEGNGQTNNNRDATFQLRNKVAIYGGFNGTETSLDQRNWQTNTTILSGDLDQNDGTGSPTGNNAFNVVRANDTYNAILDGFTIQNGLANQTGVFNRQNGAGILNGGGNPTLQNLIITNNYALGDGGVQPGDGGGVYNIGSTAVFSNVVIGNNQATHHGGGFYNTTSSTTLVNVTFSSNTSLWDGGGFYNTSGNPALQDVLFSQNQGRLGAGMFNENGDGSLTNVTFQGNDATSWGGGMMNSLGSNPSLTNVLFAGNEAESFGGGLFNDASTPTLTHVTISGNRAKTCITPSFCGGGVFNFNSSPIIRNSIIWNNQERGNVGTAQANIYNFATIGSSNPQISHSTVQGSGGSGAGWNGSMGLDMGGNLANDPLFETAVNPATTPTTAGDLRLQGTSPAIDAGNNTLCPATDLRGETRTDWGCDMGVYEAQFSDLDTMSRTVQAGQTITFGPTLVRLVVNDTASCLTGVTITRTDADHPQATTIPLQTGRYWTITAVGCQSGFDVDLSLLTPNPVAGDKLCRWDTDLSKWDCGLEANHMVGNGPLGGESLTRLHVSQFSQWTVGKSLSITAVSDSDSTDEDTPFTTGDVLANDSSDTGDPIFVESIQITSTVGQVTDNGDGTFGYDPNGQFEWLAVGETAVDSFDYVVSDEANRVTATVSITIQGVNDAPTAENDTAVTPEDTPHTVMVLTNDDDVDESDTLTLSTVGQPAHGVAQLSGTAVSYTPTLNFNGTDVFTYTIGDGTTEDTAVITVTISAVNDPPQAANDTITTDEDTAVSITPLSNDTDVENDALTLTGLGMVANGTAVIQGNTVLYTPTALFNGVDVFTYTVSDGTDADTAVITVTVSAINNVPTAQNDSGSTNEDTAFTTQNVLVNDADADDDALTVTSIDTNGTLGQVTDNGDGTFGYDPNGQFESLAIGQAAIDSFGYTVGDGNGGSDTAVVTITIQGVNDAPTAVGDSGNTDENTSFTTVNVLLNDADVDKGDVLLLNGVDTTNTAGQVINNDDGTFGYNPNGQFEWLAVGETAVDSFGYIIADSQGVTATALITITVTGVNDLPTAQNDTADTPEDTPRTILVLGNDSDVDGSDVLSITGVLTPTNGTATTNGSTITYTPTQNYNGLDVFAYTISDGHGGSDTAVVTMTVGAVNDAPIAMADTTTTAEDTAVTIDAINNDSDPDGDTLNITQIGMAANGTAVIQGNTLLYTPTLNFYGIDVFTYTVSDGQLSDTAVVTITMSAVNDAPMAINDTSTTDEDTAVVIDAINNDEDVDGDSLNIIQVGMAANGTAVIQGNILLYTPTANFYGTDVFTYTISDGQFAHTATVTMSVNPVNDLPVAGDDVATTKTNTAVVINVLVNDADPIEGSALTITQIETPTHGHVLIVGDTILYTPDPSYVGVEQFTYTISDGEDSVTATITVLVEPYTFFMPIVVTP